MNKIIRKAYWDFEKEEIWLNQMMKEGYALKKYTWCKYEFEECKSEEYIYRIEFLEKSISRAETTEYIEFLEEQDIELISTYQNWIYLRKKAEKGSFELFTDLNSRISHYKRIYSMWFTLMIVELLIGFYNLLTGIFIFRRSYKIFAFNLTLGVFIIIIGLIFLKLVWDIRHKINTLKKEERIRE